jgi:ribosome-associated protein
MSRGAPAPLLELDFALQGEFITLSDLLKAASLVGSGGLAKLWIQNGEVQVDGQIETRRACKLRRGQSVRAAGVVVRLV